MRQPARSEGGRTGPALPKRRPAYPTRALRGRGLLPRRCRRSERDERGFTGFFRQGVIAEAQVGVRARSAGLSKSGNPGSASLRSGNDLNLPRVVADQKMSRWSANETEDAMKRTILIAAALLASALSANAAPVKKHLRVVHGRACHETVLTGDDAVRYALGIFNGTAPFPRLECYPVARAGGSR